MTGQMAEGRTAPLDPPWDLWEAAQAEFDAGKVLRFIFTVSGDSVPVAVTLGWLRSWRREPLTWTQRTAVRTACAQIARDRIHPCLGKRRVEYEPIGSWKASPCPGVTVTWRPHWGEADVPVMLTLDVVTEPG